MFSQNISEILNEVQYFLSIPQKLFPIASSWEAKRLIFLGSIAILIFDGRVSCTIEERGEF